MVCCTCGQVAQEGPTCALFVNLRVSGLCDLSDGDGILGNDCGKKEEAYSMRNLLAPNYSHKDFGLRRLELVVET
jgi:hypothetical protein